MNVAKQFLIDTRLKFIESWIKDDGYIWSPHRISKLIRDGVIAKMWNKEIFKKSKSSGCKHRQILSRLMKHTVKMHCNKKK